MCSRISAEPPDTHVQTKEDMQIWYRCQNTPPPPPAPQQPSPPRTPITGSNVSQEPPETLSCTYRWHCQNEIRRISPRKTEDVLKQWVVCSRAEDEEEEEEEK